MYPDINKHTGQNTGALEHLAQSISDILTTPLASRLMRRTYGSALFDLVDTPAGEAGRARLYAAVAGALMTWERERLQITRVNVVFADAAATAGRVVLSISGYALIAGQVIPLNGFEVNL